MKKKQVRKKTVNVVFLLDETGSMFSIKSDTIGGFNNFIDEQKKSPFNIKFSMTLFNSNHIDRRYTNENINNVEQLSDENYVPNYATPLWDAIGKTIQGLTKKKNVLFVILTDGYENASREFNSHTVKDLIKEKEKAGWKFLYLGVDMVDMSDAFNMGIDTKINISGTEMASNYRSISDTVCAFAISGELKYDVDDKK